MANHREPRLRVIFAGTPAFAVPSLTTLTHLEGVKVVAVYTQPDRNAGRGRALHASSIKQTAHDLKLPIEQPVTWKDETVLASFAAYGPDLLVVAAYGVILPAAALTIPRLGAINVHASLLPRWRGAAPIQRAIMAGDHESGICIMQVVPALDAGPVLLELRCALDEHTTGGTLEIELAELGARGLQQAIRELQINGEWHGVVQDESLVTYAAKITREDRVLDLQEPAQTLVRRIRALSPSPLATLTLGDAQINIGAAVEVDTTIQSPPGTVLHAGPAGIDFATGHGVLRVTELQPPGKRPMSARDFLNGYSRLLNNDLRDTSGARNN